MVEVEMLVMDETAEVAVSRIYEVGYHILPTAKEDELEKIVGSIRALIEKQGGSFIAEGAPQLVRLAYAMPVAEKGGVVGYDRAYFGWIKFEAPVAIVEILNEELRKNTSVIRAIVFKTVREDTRAQIKSVGLREVKRTDTIKSTPRKQVVATEGTVSEEDLDKAIEGLTTE